jgi:nucleotide-binding universal stress UspA family protein
MKILLAVDGSEFTKRMLAWLATHPEVLGAGAEQHRYTAITAVLPVPAHIGHELPGDMVQRWYENQAQAVLDPVREFARRHGWPLETRAPVAGAAQAVADEASQGGHDLVLMGSHGHSAMGSLLLGSVTQRVLASCRVPVLIVR